MKKSEEIRFEEIKAQVCYRIDVTLLFMVIVKIFHLVNLFVCALILYLLFHVVKGTQQ